MQRPLVFLIVTALYGIIYTMFGAHFNFEHPVDPFYFSATVGSTTGFGDHLPTTPLAKFLVMTHQLLVATALLSMILPNKRFSHK